MDRPFGAFALVNRLRSTYWFLPAVVTILAVALGIALTAIDRSYPNATAWLGWAYGGGADGARALLSAVAGSTVTVVSVTFSVMVVALTVSSQHFGPRLLNSFMRDNAAQLVLGTFTGTFAYCLIVLRTVQGDGGDRYAAFVPHLAVTAAVVLTLVSVGMLIYYVHHVSVSMQVSEIAAGVARDLERTIDRLYPAGVGESIQAPVRDAPPVPGGAIDIRSPASGYVERIDGDAVLALASAHDTTIWLTARPGDFVIEGMPVASAYPPPCQLERLAEDVAGTYVVAADRTSYQDVSFAIQQLVEVALRALSPGVNEPFTAITCIDRLGQGLTRLASRQIPADVRTDDHGEVRVVTEPRTFANVAAEAFEPIALYAGRNPAIGERLLRTLTRLAAVTRRPEDEASIIRIASFVLSATAKQLEDEDHQRRLGRLHEELRQTFHRRRPDGPCA